MNSRVRVSTIVKPSIVSAKGCLHPDLNSVELLIKKNTEVERVSIAERREHDLASILVENRNVTGHSAESGVGIYWIPVNSLS